MNHNILITKQAEEFIITEDGRKFLNDFQITNTIGEGTFGKVLLAIHNSTQEKVAIKLLSKKKLEIAKDKDRVNKEINLMKKLNHINVTQLYQVIETDKTICLILEYCSGTDLLQFLKSRRRISEDEAKIIFSQLLSALDYIHQYKIAHRDIKLENILYTDNTIKLIDFGLSNQFLENKLLSTACGSPSYVSPEIIMGSYYDATLSDIWSCGIVLFALVAGRLPFEANSESELYEVILKGEYSFPKSFSFDLCSILSKILVVNPKNRHEISKLKSHNWLAMYYPSWTKGILPTIIPPIDYDIACLMLSKNNSLKIEEMVRSILENERNCVSTEYYLILKRKLKKKVIFFNNFSYHFDVYDSISDFSSELFKKYINFQINNSSLKININDLIANHIYLIEGKLVNSKSNSSLFKNYVKETINNIDTESNIVTTIITEKIDKNQENDEILIKDLTKAFVNGLMLKFDKSKPLYTPPRENACTESKHKKSINYKSDIKQSNNPLRNNINFNKFINSSSSKKTVTTSNITPFETIIYRKEEKPTENGCLKKSNQIRESRNTSSRVVKSLNFNNQSIKSRINYMIGGSIEHDEFPKSINKLKIFSPFSQKSTSTKATVKSENGKLQSSKNLIVPYSSKIVNSYSEMYKINSGSIKKIQVSQPKISIFESSSSQTKRISNYSIPKYSCK